MLDRLILAAALACAAWPALAEGAADARFAATTLDIDARGEARLPPDMARVSLGAQVRAPAAGDAEGQAAAAMQRVIASLHALGLAGRDLQTSGVSLHPQYSYSPGAAPQLTGYEADASVEARVEDLSRLGAAIDAAVKAGANSVGDIEFGLANPAAAEAFARLAAVKALEDKAQAYASATGYHVQRLVSLSEGYGMRPLQFGASAAPPPLMMAAARAAPAMPVEAGEVVVSVDVAGEFELAR